MQKIRTIILFFIIYFTFYFVQTKDGNIDNIVFIEDSDEYGEDFIDLTNNAKAKNIERKYKNAISSELHSWVGDNEELFYLKIVVFICVLIAVIINAVIGKQANRKIALFWLRSCKGIFLEQFAKLGHAKYFLLEKSYDNYDLYCSGRKNCNYYSVNLDLSKRQCLWRYYVFNYFVKQNDTMSISINFDKLDKVFFCVYKKHQKKNIESRFPNLNKYTKFMNKKELKQLYEIKADSSEVTDLVLSGHILNFLNTNEKYINYLCISDIPFDENEEETNSVKKQETKEDKKEGKKEEKQENINKKSSKHKFCILNLIIPQDESELQTLIKFSIYMIDACVSIELPDKVREHVKKLRSIIDKEDDKKKQELKELQEKKRIQKIQEEKEKIDKMPAEQQRKYEEKKQKKSLKKMKKIKIIKM
ncbi:conserved protein, unknown function [Hepatocystis sp. ex Piliocolobus tephrosceles]|nr:conserved protein, unknown function [Hepatocystis sp. ex Piliocolobus tephrosceles]